MALRLSSSTVCGMMALTITHLWYLESKCASPPMRVHNGFSKYPPAEPGALGIGPLEAATLDPKLYLFGRRTKYSLPTSPRPFIQFFLHHFGEQMPLDSCVAT